MDHSVKVMNSHRKVAFSRIFQYRRFENAELELLYQRYIFKLQQSSIVSALLLLACLSISMAVLQFYYTSSATVIGLFCVVQCVVFLGLFLLSFRMHDTQLLALCYVILLFCVLFCLLLAPIRYHFTSWNALTWWSIPHKPTEGVWSIVLVTFVTYTMLPIKVGISIAVSLCLCAAHIAITLGSVAGYKNADEDVSNQMADQHQYYIRQQVRSHLFIFLECKLVSSFVHSSRQLN